MGINVLMVTPYFPPTIKGPSLHVYHLVRNLTEKGVNVHVHTVKYGKQESSLGFNIEDVGKLNVSYFKPSFDPRGSSDDQPLSLSYITSTIRESNRFDIVHIHDFPKLCNDALILALKRLKPNKLVVLTPHGQGAPAPTYNRSSKIYWSLGIPLRVLRSSDHLVTVTSKQKEVFSEVCEAEKISMISEAIPSHYFAGRPCFSDDSKLRVLFIGRLVLEKGIADLLHALKLLSKMVQTPVELRLIGPDYGFLPEALKIVRDLHLEGAVSILGPLPEDQKISHLDWCDVLVLPSYYEAFGIPIVEAMAKGKPVIATKTVGAVSLIKDNETGFLVNFNAPQEIADRLLQFVKNPSLKHHMGQKALVSAIPFSMQNMTKNHIDLYKRLLDNRH